MAEMRVRIKELMSLLGGTILPHSTVLITGAPGTGKSTLCTELMAWSAVDKGEWSGYAAIDDGDDPGSPFINKMFDRVAKKYTGLKIRDFVECHSFREFLERGAEMVTPGEKPTTTRPKYKTVDDACTSVAKYILENVVQRSEKEQEKLAWVIIDSVSALIDVLAQVCDQKATEREILVSLIRNIMQFSPLPKSLRLILTSERDSTHEMEPRPEDYVVDAVINLVRDRVPTLRDSKIEETLLFCQVTKNRGGRHQRRRSNYDFSDDGFEFFPTYAADGRICLFFENEPQQEVIRQLKDVDIPALYPRVEVEEFKRSGLQNTFAIRRRAMRLPVRRMPRRFPMVLSNFDEFWIKEFKEGIEPLLETIPAELPLYASSEMTGVDAEHAVISELREKKLHLGGQQNKCLVGIPQWVNVGLLVFRMDLVKRPPHTWEDFEDDYNQTKWKETEGSFLLETRTDSTFVATMLELFWSHGAIFTVERKGTGGKCVLNWPLDAAHPGWNSREKAVDAMERLTHWVHERRIIRQNSTVDPNANLGDRWIFARHWHSTLVDCQSWYNGKARQDLALPAVDPTILGISRMPISKAYAAIPTGTKISIRGKEVPVHHHSCWGEWYLGVHRGTENLQLAWDLLTHLMSARKVIERALSGAGIPSLEPFYRTFGECVCPATDKTFNALRSELFPTALSRTMIDDYPRVADILNGLCRAIIATRKNRREISSLLDGAWGEICSV